jgi:DNA polymerase-3 subunit beta
MKATFDRESLLQGFQLAASVIPSRVVRPVLANVKLSAGPDRVVARATDLESVGISYEIRGVRVEKAGDVLLPSGHTGTILRELPDQEVAIEGNGEGVWIRGAASEFQLPGEDPEHYPDVPGFSGDNYHQVQAGVLRELIHRTSFAVAQESVRYALSGVMWELGPERFRLVATDGRRLAVADGIGLMQGNHNTESVMPVVPSKAVTLIERNLSDPEEQVLVHFGPNEVLVKTSRAEIYGRLVEGRFPSYKDVLPKKRNAVVKVAAGAFHSAVRQAAAVNDPDSRRVQFDFGKGKVTLSSGGSERGRARVELPVEHEGKALQIGFDPRYLLDMLRVLDSDAEVVLELVDSESPAVFRVGTAYVYVVMPLAGSPS